MNATPPLPSGVRPAGLHRGVLCGLLLASLVAFAGCSKGEESSTLPALPQVAKGPGKVTGRVVLLGKPPAMKSELVACDPRPGSAKMTHVDKTVTVSADGGLADVYVYVTNINGSSPPQGSGRDEAQKVLDQVDCAFVPHALAIQVGQPLKIRNSDPTFHNVHWDGKANPGVNHGFGPSPSAPEKIVALNAAEFLSVRCDVHPWMTSTIGVFDHPFFATTDADGRYTIEGLPPGRYTVTAWHPYYQRAVVETVEVTVSETGAGQADFTYGGGGKTGG